MRVGRTWQRWGRIAVLPLCAGDAGLNTPKTPGMSTQVMQGDGYVVDAIGVHVPSSGRQRRRARAGSEAKKLDVIVTPKAP
jgi:hypothetical protein